MSAASHATSPSDEIDALLADLSRQERYGVPSYDVLLDYATADFDRTEPHNNREAQDGDDIGIMCPHCVEELREHGIEEMMGSWHRKDPYCTVVTDTDEVPQQFRPDKDVKYEEYMAVLCPDHPEFFLAYMEETYDDADTPLE